jgi:bacterial/archaeal transporter family protein
MVWFVFAFMSALGAAIASIIEKRTLSKEHAMEFCAVLAIFNFVLSIPFLLKSDLSQLTAPIFVWILIVAFIDTFAFLFIVKAVRHMEISAASPLLTFGPLFTLLVAFFFLGESVSLNQLFGLSLIVVGAYVLELSKKSDFWEPFRIMMRSKYIHYILFGLLLYGFSSTIGRYLVNEEYAHHISPYLLLPLLHFFIMVGFFILISVVHDGVKGIQHGFKNAGRWIFFVSLFMVFGRMTLLLAMAVPFAKAGLVVAIKRMSALFATIIGGEIFHEQNMIHKIIACIIMVVGAYFVVI